MYSRSPRLKTLTELRHVDHSANIGFLKNLKLLSSEASRCVELLGACERALSGLVELLARYSGVVELGLRGKVLLALLLERAGSRSRLVEDAIFHIEARLFQRLSIGLSWRQRRDCALRAGEANW